MAKKTSKKTSSKSSPSNPLADKIKHLKDKCGLTTVEAVDRSSMGGFPVGRGQVARMEEATIRLNRNEDPMITWHLIGIGQTNENRHEFVNINLTDDEAGKKRFPYVKADAEAMGLDWDGEVQDCLDTLAKHPDATAVHIEGAEGLEVLCDVWMNNEFKNYAITGLAEDGSGEGSAEGTSGSEDTLTKADIEAMSDPELEQLARDETNIDPDTVETYDELREMLIKELV
jgi:hypothetical protein